MPSPLNPTSVPFATAAVSAPVSEHERWFAPAAVLATIAIGHALQLKSGALSPGALVWISVAFALVLAATVIQRPLRAAHVDAWFVPAAALVGLILNLAQLYTRSSPAAQLQLQPGSLSTFHAGLAVLAVLGAGVIGGRGGRTVLRAQIAGVVAIHFALGVWLIRHSPTPQIDTFIFQRDAVAALLHGVDPYGLTFPNIYLDSEFYGPGLSVDGRLQFGFPYPPLSLLLSLPGQIFGGDVRSSQLVAMEAAALLMAFTRPGIFGRAAAVLYLTTPRVFLVLEQSWTEPFVVLGLAALVFAAARESRLVPWLFGAFLATKQHLILAVPVALLLRRWPLQRRDVLVFLAIAATVVAVLTAPFLLWNPTGFWKSVVMLQVHQPFRVDALSYLAWWASLGHRQWPSAVGFAALAAASGLALWRLPRTAGGFAAAVSIIFFAFFAFNKQAFCNYYFFVIGALCTALAAWHVPKDVSRRDD